MTKCTKCPVVLTIPVSIEAGVCYACREENESYALGNETDPALPFTTNDRGQWKQKAERANAVLEHLQHQMPQEEHGLATTDARSIMPEQDPFEPHPVAPPSDLVQAITDERNARTALLRSLTATQIRCSALLEEARRARRERDAAIAERDELAALCEDIARGPL